ncbi:unnamed protein product [Cladocopium goreaui]|uniref:ATP-dependent Clp protease ATP-binding subunit clpA-like n=1 Tax=Cladocopium goreaui TaxID=2562237 RepID=A0A9P1G6F8_9DINO|nr:unnamed protein product [Cladocopium goreaui]|mmetsp:Transcript_61233/g.124243  ORF Transcript_61233/g.124243 Transcript_61233/m.124243 type:complete len:188 (+) Transcript_61233:92-655(+)
MAAITLPVCSRCERSGHVAANCPKSFFKVCAYCKEVGHVAKSCPKALAKDVAALDDSSSTISTSSRSTAATSAISRAAKVAGPKEDVKISGLKRDKGGRSRKEAAQPEKLLLLDPRSQSLSEVEELEARKLEKKLREIAALEEKRDAGARLDVLQIKKLESRAELEDRSVMRKVRLGYARLRLESDR